MRRLIILVVVLSGLAVGADRLAVVAAQRVVAERVQADAHLAARPDVTIGGFPFLTQAFGGRYDEVTVVAHDVKAGDVVISEVRTRLRGVHVSLGDVLSQSVSSVPVDRADARLRVGYDALRVDVAQQLGGAAQQAVDAQLFTGADVQGNTLVLHTRAGVEVPVQLPGLPFGLHLVAATLDNTGVALEAAAQGITLRR